MGRVILVGVDEPGDTDAAIDWAAAEAAQRQLSLLLVHSVGWLLQTVAGHVGLIRTQLEDAGTGWISHVCTHNDTPGTACRRSVQR